MCFRQPHSGQSLLQQLCVQFEASRDINEHQLTMSPMMMAQAAPSWMTRLLPTRVICMAPMFCSSSSSSAGAAVRRQQQVEAVQFISPCMYLANWVAVPAAGSVIHHMMATLISTLWSFVLMLFCIRSSAQTC
jgi:hypothetical protein